MEHNAYELLTFSSRKQVLLEFLGETIPMLKTQSQVSVRSSMGVLRVAMAGKNEQMEEDPVKTQDLNLFYWVVSDFV